MSSLNQGLWKAPQNSLIPALTHLLSFKVNYTALGVGASTTVALPLTTGLGPATYTAAQAPSNYSISSSPVAANNEPQQGCQTYISHMMLRNLNAPLTPTGGTANANAVQLIDQSQSNNVIVTMAGPAAAATAAPYYVASVTTGNVIVQPYDQLAITINAATAVASTNTGFVVDLFGWTNQGL